MSRPRNPRYFPRMKVRGARRRKLAPYQRVYGAFDEMAASSAKVARLFDQLAASMRMYECGTDWIRSEQTDDH